MQHLCCKFVSWCKQVQKCLRQIHQYAWSSRHACQTNVLDALQAKEAYQRASELEPDDAHLLDALQKVDTMERKEAEQHRHKFTRKSRMPAGTDKPDKKQKSEPKLSFDEDD